MTMTQEHLELRVGVLDDDACVASLNALCLNHLGHYAVPYSSVPAILNDLDRQSFNAFLLDWNVGNVTSKNLIAAVRAVDSAAPIVVLSGAVGSNDSCCREIAASAKVMGFIAVQKPSRIPTIAALLLSAMPGGWREVA